MTAHRDLKRVIRERQRKTGESYTTARSHVMREREARMVPESATTAPASVEAVVLKLNQQSARVRILGEEGEVTFRSPDVWGLEPVVPGHLATLVMGRRWTWRGDAYASGRILSLNPSDNQGVRFCWDDVRKGRRWEEMQARENAKRAEMRRRLEGDGGPSSAGPAIN